MSTVVSVLAILTCLRVVQSDDVINILALQPGQLVSGNVSLEASDTYAVNTSTAPYRIRTSVAGVHVNATSVVIVVRGHGNVLKWTVPSDAESFRSNVSLLTAEHTLAPCLSSSSTFMYIDVITDSPTPVTYSLLVDKLELFNLSMSDFYNTTLMLAQPQIYYFEFPVGISAVNVNVTSNDSNTCAFVSVQSTATCPPADTLYNAIVMGTDQSMTTNAFFTITRERLGQSSFYLVLIPASSGLCHEALMSDEGGDSYAKPVTFSVQQSNTLSMHWLEVWLPVVVMATCSALTGLLYFCYITLCLCHPARKIKGCMGCIHHVCCEEAPAISNMICYCVTPKTSTDTERRGDRIAEEEKRHLTKDAQEVENGKHNSYGGLRIMIGLPQEPTSRVRNLNLDPNGAHLQEDLLQKNESELRLSHFTDTKFQTVKVRHTAYIWNTVTVGIYYGIPALQVVFAKALAQQMFPVYQEDEQCYYNYQCAIALGYVPAVNSVLSNSGYVVLGTMFVVIVAIRECYYSKKLCFKHGLMQKGLGLTPGNGLYYAMGFALIGEGVMSALYHVCPSDINFQFDTTFMFIIAGLIIAKMIQNRHPYFNANSFCTFWGFSVVTLATIVGLYVDRKNPLAARVALFFILLVITALFYFSLFHFNQFAVLCNPKMWRVRKSRLIRLTCALVFDSIVLAVLFFYNQLDIATTILTLFALNAVVLLAWYLGSKCLHSEPRIFVPVIILLLALGFWLMAGTYFSKKIYNSGKTPVESRELNRPCYIGGFYDYHDFWHFLSAAAVFTSFMSLLTLDDGLKMKEHSEIHVF
ncbi:hypothetical protein EMCRGX_G032576 [Ephydatia muelleri]|eukprot:Em0019g145a